ncbi:DUF1513 domain-containing protein [Rhodoferax sp. PAMC 29310]|uniref:DUF1513 domain-containing protein n=1 Tax=Rhodoferax sp. PAMC 29310 TaxID=2822760 RepID=UPI001B333DC8|nr:DUF1513 domain-containing protein [Rhodoferax sp. PAMC 29310]
MATERTPITPSRRTWLSQAVLAGLGPWLGNPVWASPIEAPTTLLATWQTPDAHHIGLVDVAAKRWRVNRSLAVPTRAHGVMVESSDSVLALARRPGDWLLRWHPRTGETQWHWIGGERRFNGHVVASPQGDTLWTTETDLETAQGRLGVRDSRSLEKTDEWATHGMDPHALMVLPQALGRIPAGSLMVANGGISALPETGRAKHDLGRMDASLVALNPQTGAVLGQWRLVDSYLSIRHFAWDAVSKRVGIALQSENPDGAQRQSAPVLAVWDGEQLLPSVGQPVLQGYGGDICARPGGGFVVSCPRANALALFTPASAWSVNLPHRDTCALVAQGDQWWASGPDGILSVAPHHDNEVALAAAPEERLQFDNHWQIWPLA